MDEFENYLTNTIEKIRGLQVPQTDFVAAKMAQMVKDNHIKTTEEVLRTYQRFKKNGRL